MISLTTSNGQGLQIMSQASAMTLPARSARQVSSVNAFSLLLVVNGVALALTGFVQSMFDLGGHFLNRGPLGPSLHGNLDALGFLEAHGLAVIIGVLLVLHRNAPDARWHWIASATHVLLGAANLMFWPIFKYAVRGPDDLCRHCRLGLAEARPVLGQVGECGLFRDARLFHDEYRPSSAHVCHLGHLLRAGVPGVVQCADPLVVRADVGVYDPPEVRMRSGGQRSAFQANEARWPWPMQPQET